MMKELLVSHEQKWTSFSVICPGNQNIHNLNIDVDKNAQIVLVGLPSSQLE